MAIKTEVERKKGIVNSRIKERQMKGLRLKMEWYRSRGGYE